MTTLTAAAAWGSAPAGATDAATSKALVVTAADAGAQYRASKGQYRRGGFAKVAACEGRQVQHRRIAASSFGPQLVSAGGETQITSANDIVATTATAAADRAVLTDGRYPACAAQLLQSQQGRRVVSVTAQPLSVNPPYGDLTTAVGLHVVTSTTGSTPPLTVTIITIQKGRAEVSVTFTRAGNALFDPAEAAAILLRLDQRLESTHRLGVE